MSVCKVEDEFLTEKLHWIATLSNDEIVYQDDHRPGEDPPQAWLRLIAYLKDKKLDIQEIKIRFCSHIEVVSPADFVGVFFTKGLDGFINVKRSYLSYIFGFVLQDSPDLLHCTKWLVPEILPIENEIRPLPVGDEKLWLKNKVN